MDITTLLVVVLTILIILSLLSYFRPRGGPGPGPY